MDESYLKGYRQGITDFVERLKDEAHVSLPTPGYPVDEEDAIIYKDELDDIAKDLINQTEVI